MGFLKKHIYTVLLIVASFVLIWQNISNSKWRENQIIRSDVAIYYTYLPATFIYGNPLFEGEVEQDSKFRIHTSPTGRNAVKMSMGVAMLETPFFLGGHLYALLDSRYEADGFSSPYHLSISLSSVFFTIFGLIFLGLFLKKRFSKTVTLLTLFFIAFGTNLYHYTVNETGMAHPPTFFLVASLLLLTDRWILDKKIWKSLLIGLVFGMIVLIRPINILFCVPFLFFLKQPEDLWKVHLQRLFLPLSHIVLIIVGAFLIMLPQLLFWKVQTGGFMYYSYRDEGFFWTNPHIWEGLFSFRKGWLLYTPMMFLALLGLIPLYKTKKEYFIGIVVFIVPFLYITFSWWCWWYGGGFGARTLIDILPFMAIPLAALLTWLLKNKVRMSLVLIPFFFVYLNNFQTWQYFKGYIHYDSMTKEGYKKIWWMTHTPEGYWELLQRPDYENAKLKGVEEKFVSVE
ncbi:hypothetical protein [Brumimicrobium sp.]|uniref:hypothetical protein n=1 Tax=Brumimicrobium sp. TaxID=2029867 RepID=UPI003A915DB5